MSADSIPSILENMKLSRLTTAPFAQLRGSSLPATNGDSRKITPGSGR